MVGGSLFGDLAGFLADLGTVGLWLQAVGIVVILWIIFQIIAYIYNRRRMREIYNIKKDMIRIERKIDKILHKKR